MTNTTAAAPTKPAEDNPGDLFSLLSSFASRMAILSSISEKERFWEDPTAGLFNAVQISLYARMCSRVRAPFHRA
jgi:hypothetical protein